MRGERIDCQTGFVGHQLPELAAFVQSVTVSMRLKCHYRHLSGIHAGGMNTNFLIDPAYCWLGRPLDLYSKVVHYNIESEVINVYPQPYNATISGYKLKDI